LLMIAIAVVGGVMIYVFTQGFFGNSSISTSPSVDTITMSGYDMRAIPAATGITTHELLNFATYGDAGVAGMADGEEGSIFIRNVGQKSYTISKIEVNGRQMTFDGVGPLTSGEYGILTVPDAATATAGTTLRGAPTILPGEEGTLVISFDGDGLNNDDNNAADGRTIPVRITSAGGSVYNFNVVIGSKA
ncbi:MAG TPA: hypothetical protein VD699_04870, partial [Nitrosopumilaceae archaeon]|nr:hypothetical protein [Nitrosopumilaceae archaeon]